MKSTNFGISEEILGIPNVKIIDIKQNDKEIRIYLEFTNGTTICPICKCECDTIHERKEKKVIRDIPILGKKCYLYSTHRRFYCSKCNKTFMERLNWINPYERLTKRFADWLKEWGLKMDLKNLSNLSGLGYSTIERLMKNHYMSYLFPNKEDFPINAGIDEFSQIKGRNNFCTIISNNDTNKPFDILPSRDEAKLKQYFSLIPTEARENAESFTMDMWKPFIKLIPEFK